MKSHLFIIFLAFALAVMACDSSETPVPTSLPLNDLVQTAQANIAVTQTLAAINQPAAVIQSTPTAIPPTALTQNTIAKIGERVVQGDYALTVTNMEAVQQYGIFAADAGKQFIAVEVLIESNANAGVSVNPLYASVQDSDGYQYNMSAMGKDPALNSQNDLPAGEKMRGWVTFEIPQTSHNLIFMYEPLTFDNSIRFRVDLGR